MPKILVKIKALSAIVVLLAAPLAWGDDRRSHTGQQPRVQAPAPDSCDQAMRENAAYRDRVSSLERQIDATEESAKTFYLRAATWETAYFNAMRLANEYRHELAVERDRANLERDLLRSSRSRRNR